MQHREKKHWALDSVEARLNPELPLTLTGLQHEKIHVLKSLYVCFLIVQVYKSGRKGKKIHFLLPVSRDINHY